MLEAIKLLQENKVDELLKLVTSEKGKEYTLKAPTGSGKTYMQGYLISKLLKKYPNAKIIYQSLSKANLTNQNYDQIVVNYNFSNINAFLLSTDKTSQERLSIPLNYNTYFLPKDLNKKTANLEIPLKNFLTYQTKKAKKFLIIDECHETSKNIMKYKNEFECIFGFSATPKKEQLRTGTFVELNEETCINFKLIKNKQIKRIDEIDNSLQERLQNSLNDFKQIQKEYKGTGINPALIIQISNSFQGKEQKKEIIEILKNFDEGMLWYYEDAKGFESSDRINELKGINSKKRAREYIIKSTSNVPIIIFKLTFKEGFDIPRACYLLQIRKTQSETLDEQVIGRIRRNPKLKDFDSLTNEQKQNIMIAYINGVEQQTTRQVKFVKSKKKIKIQTTVLKNKIPQEIRKINQLELKNNDLPKNIFELKENWDKLDAKIKFELGNITKEEWIKYCLNIDTLNKESYNINYKNNVINNGKYEIQKETFYRIDSYQTYINNWIWEHSDDETDKTYSFESEAEKKIAHDLSLMKLDFWGKNFFNNSKINFEYFLRQKGNFLISKQHPDFLVIKNNKKYLIEVKSYRHSNSQSNFDSTDYKTKVESIKAIYQEAANVTDQIFALIIEEDSGWTTYVYEKNNNYNLYNKEKLKFLIS
ncbi:hypothetical protein LT336_00072 [Spiroplasma sp. JKS002671]|uniref:DEAD/DEAH box helicase family protein n=1 Tax=Spiroplasma attinicola TaxID=2904537 RepID=UPI0020229E3C|nr:DEAD/DEAH box helicase family protein [Spiroplasma sp. JKS002671]MCL8210342.1 hypothetical protein [Spiroplasma sp. JKS002671]